MQRLIPRQLRAGFAGLILTLVFSGVAQANLVTNGSFEANNSFIERAGFPRLDDVNGSAPTGWTRDSGDLAEYMTRGPAYDGVTIYNPVDGDYFIGADPTGPWFGAWGFRG